MNITFRQLRLLQALADTRSVSAAARLLHVTQPTASMQLKEISQAVGLPLYEWVGKKLYLTDVGQELAATARTVSQAWEHFEQQVDARKGLSKGRLRIAVVSTAQYFMPRWVGAFCKQYPAIEVALEILNRDGVVQRLRDNRDDLYIMSQPPADLDLKDDVLMSNPIVLIAPLDEPHWHGRRWQLNELAQERFILRERGSGTRMRVDQHFREQGFKPLIRLELGSNEAVKESVAAGLGLGLISQHALHGQEHENGVAVLSVEGFALDSAWHMVHLASKPLSPVAQAFKRHVQADF